MSAAAIRRNGTRRGTQRMRGVTLIELMMVVTIIGIIMAIAYPGYQSQMQKTRRADGKAALLDTAQRFERCYTRFNSYAAAAGCDVATDLADADNVPSKGSWYVITDAAPAATTFSLVATPQRTQVDDTACANLTLNNLGARGATGTAPATCW